MLASHELQQHDNMQRHALTQPTKCIQSTYKSKFQLFGWQTSTKASPIFIIKYSKLTSNYSRLYCDMRCYILNKEVLTHSGCFCSTERAAWTVPVRTARASWNTGLVACSGLKAASNVRSREELPTRSPIFKCVAWLSLLKEIRSDRSSRTWELSTCMFGWPVRKLETAKHEWRGALQNEFNPFFTYFSQFYVRKTKCLESFKVV